MFFLFIVDGDCEIKKYCQEGTPSWMSKSNSHTNLSTLSIEDVKLSEPEMPVAAATNETGNQGSDSEDTSEDEELLQNVIKSAWEHNRNISKVRFFPNSNIIFKTYLLTICQKRF